MGKFVAGFVTGALVCVAAGAAWMLLDPGDPCAGACRGGLTCLEGICVAVESAQIGSAEPDTRKKKRGRAGAAPLLPANDVPKTVGTLGPEEPVRIDMEKGGPGPLADAEIETRIDAVSPRIIECLTAAEARIVALAPGTVTVSFRVRSGGNVGGVRVTAAASLQAAGLSRCIAGHVKKLRFPTSTGTVVTYPFTHR